MQNENIPTTTDPVKQSPLIQNTLGQVELLIGLLVKARDQLEFDINELKKIKDALSGRERIR